MNSDDRANKEGAQLTRPVASFLVRLWPSLDHELHGVATHVQTGDEIPFANQSALVEILNSKAQLDIAGDDDDESK